MNLLKFQRLQLGISQNALAIATRIDQSALSQMELGRLIPSPSYRKRLAEALGVSPEGLLSEVKIERPRGAGGRYAQVGK